MFTTSSTYQHSSIQRKERNIIATRWKRVGPPRSLLSASSFRAAQELKLPDTASPQEHCANTDTNAKTNTNAETDANDTNVIWRYKCKYRSKDRCKCPNLENSKQPPLGTIMRPRFNSRVNNLSADFFAYTFCLAHV